VVGYGLIAVGVWFFVVAYWGYTHADRPAHQEMSAGWLSSAAGRRLGGLLVMASSVTMIVTGIIWR
jgi:hypothetical protein